MSIQASWHRIQASVKDCDITVTFFFDENPFFVNTELWKRWKVKSESGDDNEISLIQVEVSGSDFAWKKTPQAEALKKEIKPETSDDEDKADDADDEDVEDGSLFTIFDLRNKSISDLVEMIRSEIYPDPWNIYNERVEEEEE
eukprot:gene37592-49220_t